MKGRHLAIETHGGFQQCDAEGGAGAFAEAHIEIQQRARVEEFEHFPVTSFGGAVREDHVIERCGIDRAGDDGGCAGDESVEHHHVAPGGRAENQAGDGGDFESSEGGESLIGSLDRADAVPARGG